MAKAQQGDRSAYEMLLRACIPMIRRVARGRGVASDRLDDVVQDVLMTVHRARHTYEPERSFTAWLVTIAQRRAIDLQRRTGRADRREVHAPIAYDNYAEPGRDDPGAELDYAAGLGEALDLLPPGQREAIEALAVRQLSLEEASRLSGRSKGALKVNMHRALKTLRAHFGGAA